MHVSLACASPRNSTTTRYTPVRYRRGRNHRGICGEPVTAGLHFDAFVSHSHNDATWVETLAARLEDEKGLHIWLDKWILIPGEPWQRNMARGLEQAASCVVIVGSQTPAGWFQEEVEKALNRQVHDKAFRVIPVLAPGGDPANLPDFVDLRTWADFRDADNEEYALHLLSQGIRGLPIGRWPPRDNTVATESRFKAKLVELQHMSVHLEREVYIDTQRNLMNKWLEDL